MQRQMQPEYEYDDYQDAESLDSADVFAFTDPHLLKLGMILDFTPEDLEANRMGELTPRQIGRLSRDLRLSYWLIIGGLSVVAFVLGTVAVLGELFPLLIPTLVLMGFALASAFVLNREINRLPETRVIYAPIHIGWVSLTLRRLFRSHESGRIQFNAPNNKHIYTEGNIYRVLRPNQTYHAYYVPIGVSGNYRILSMEPSDEPIETWKPKSKPKRASIF